MNNKTIDDTFGLWNERYEHNSNKAYSQGLTPCCMCGKGVKENSGFNVWVVLGGSSLLHVDEWDNQSQKQNDAGDMGCWLVGPECGKSIPADYKTANAVLK
jgi:hypothetical protein